MKEDSGIPVHRAARGRRRCGQQPADAVPGRPAAGAGRPAEGRRDDGLGAAYLAGLAVGFWKDRAEVSEPGQADRIFEPTQSADEAAHRRRRWAEALSRARDWEERTLVKPDGPT